MNSDASRKNLALEQFCKEGYVILDCHEDHLIDEINIGLETLVSNGEFDTNSKIYSYNSNPRIVDAYKKIPAIKSFAANSCLVSFLKAAYEAVPMPFSNILFKYGSEQPLHSDYVHHGTFPELLLCGAWTALEDITEGSGELIVVPKSHKLEIFKYVNHNLRKPRTLSEIKQNYSFYERWIQNQVAEQKLEVKKILLKKGQTICWQANLLHGGARIESGAASRKSFVIHYTFSSAKYFYNPTFSHFVGTADICKRKFETF